MHGFWAQTGALNVYGTFVLLQYMCWMCGLLLVVWVFEGGIFIVFGSNHFVSLIVCDPLIGAVASLNRRKEREKI